MGAKTLTVLNAVYGEHTAGFVAVSAGLIGRIGILRGTAEHLPAEPVDIGQVNTGIDGWLGIARVAVAGFIDPRVAEGAGVAADTVGRCNYL